MPYANPNAIVAGLSFTKGKARFHAVNVSLEMYTAILNKEGRSNIKLMELPTEMTRVQAAFYVRDTIGETLNEGEQNEIARVVGEFGKIRRYHGFTDTRKVNRYRAAASAAA